jgi:hypothetical protein
MTAFSISTPQTTPRTVIYIDGFNLYYGALKRTPNKWLNLDRLFRRMRPADSIIKIRYFTALVTGPSGPDQQSYLSALATTPLVEIILGKFKKKGLICGLAACSHSGKRLFEVQEEKRTDVNIAIYMLDDAYQDICDHFILVSGDSDLVPAIRMIRQRFPQKRITVYVPSQNPTRGYAVELRSAAHKHRDLPLNLLPISQFSSQLSDGAGGLIAKPSTW